MILQIASQLGGYGVGFLMMLSVAWLIELIQKQPYRNSEQFSWTQSNLHSLVRTTIFLWLLLSYVTWNSRQNYLKQIEPIKPLGNFLLVQDHMPTMFDATAELIEQGWIGYENTTKEAIKSLKLQSDRDSKLDAANIDLIVWPESVYSGLAPIMFWDQGDTVPEALQIDRDQLELTYENLERANAFKLRRLQSAISGPLPNLLVGTDVIDIREGVMDRYNSAVWIGAKDERNPSGSIDYYAKMHLVMFGEYIPVLSWFPSIMQRVGLATLSSGREPKAWSLPSGRRAMANVCFEDTVPHLMRRQIHRLTEQGQAPDLMINLSNDGWFRGSSILDHHLNSAILVAVENRIPVLVAANTGITAWINGDGQVVERLPKMDPGWILAKPIPDGRSGYWSRWGDWPARLVAFLGLTPVFLSLRARFASEKKIGNLNSRG